MIRTPSRTLFALLFLALILAASIASSTWAGPEVPSPAAPPGTPRVSAADPRLLLPGVQAIPGWTRAEEPRLFNGKTLFAHIDGGAEEFLAQGFRALGVGAYRKDKLETVAEVYDMGSRKGAMTILEARGGSADKPAVGEACALDSMQVLFRRDRFFVSVTGFEKNAEIATALRVFADSIDAAITRAHPAPKKP